MAVAAPLIIHPMFTVNLLPQGACMKVLRKSDASVHVRLPPFYMFGVVALLLGSVCVGLGFMTVELQGEKLDDQTGCFQITKKWLGITVSDRIIYGVVGVEVQTHSKVDRDTHSSRTTYRAALTTDRDSVPVTSGYSSGPGKAREIVYSVEAFLEAPSAKNLSLGISSMWWLGLIGIFILCLAAHFFVARVDCVIDKVAGQIRMRRVGLFGPRTSTFDLAETRQFDVETKGHLGARRGKVFRLVLVLNDGSSVPLRSTWTSGLGSKKSAAEQLTRFLISARTPTGAAVQICVLCKQDCSNEPRGADEAGNYYHLACYEAAQGNP